MVGTVIAIEMYVSDPSNLWARGVTCETTYMHTYINNDNIKFC